MAMIGPGYGMASLAVDKATDVAKVGVTKYPPSAGGRDGVCLGCNHHMEPAKKILVDMAASMPVRGKHCPNDSDSGITGGPLCTTDTG